MSKDTLKSINDETLIEELKNRGFLVVEPVCKEYMPETNDATAGSLGGRKEIYFHDLAIRVLNPVENLLVDHNILVPSNDRTGDESEAALYGMPYDNLLTKIESIFREEFESEHS